MRRAVLTVVLLTLTAWAGCLGDGSGDTADAEHVLHCEGNVCNVAVTEGAGPVNEPSLAVNPTDPCNLIAGGNDYNDGFDVWTGVYVSFDCGRTWTRDFLPGHPGDDTVTAFSRFTGAGDAAIAFAPDGTAYYAGIAFIRAGEGASSRQTGDVSAGLSTPASLIVARSDDGGRTWPGLFVPSQGSGVSGYAYGPVALPMLGGASFEATNQFEDKEWIAVAPDGTVYLSWTRYGGVYPWLSDLDPAFSDLERPREENEIYVIRSDDRGETWTDPVRVSRQFGNQGSVPAVSADGTLHIVWSEDAETLDGQNLGDAPINIMVRSSTDKGETFGGPIVLDTLGDTEPDHRFRVNGFPSLVVDPETSPYAGRLTAAWAGNRSGDGDVWMAESTDGGATWTAPVRVNQDPVGNGAAQYFPWVAVGPDGVRSFVWYDGRHDPTAHSITVWMAQTLDGVDFTETELTDAPFFTDLDGFATSNFLGDYLNVAASTEGVFAIWPDTRTATDAVGNTDLFMAWMEPAE